MASRGNSEPSRRKTSINDLPHEILVHILSFVPVPERLNCALACRSFARALSAPELTRDICFSVVGIDEPKTLDALYCSHRQYRKLRLSKVRMFAFDATLWERIGRSLRKLELIECMWSPVVFYSILQACPNLESLKICSDIRMSEWNFVLPANFSLERIKESTRDVRHLHLGFLAKANMVSSLFAALPDTLSVALTKFDGTSDFVERLPDLLGTSRKITRFDINSTVPSGQQIDEQGAKEILRTCRTTVQDIRSEDASLFTPGLLEMIGNCTGLRRLKLKRHPVIFELLISMPQNNPKLEALELGSISSPLMLETYVDAFAKLGKLRQLSLGTYLHGSWNNSAIGELFRIVETSSMLGEFSLKVFDRSIDYVTLQGLGSLSILQSLVLTRLQWEADSFKILFASPKNLRKLTISGYSLSCKHRAYRTSVDRQSEHCRTSFEQQIINFLGRSAYEQHGASKLSSLELLKIGFSDISDVSLMAIPHYHTQLREFTLIHCNRVTDDGLGAFLLDEPQLEKLELRSLETPTGAFLRALEDLCPRLRVLKLSSCREISCFIAKRFKLRRPTVKVYLDDEFIVS